MKKSIAFSLLLSTGLLAAQPWSADHGDCTCRNPVLFAVNPNVSKAAGMGIFRFSGSNPKTKDRETGTGIVERIFRRMRGNMKRGLNMRQSSSSMTF
ncbi:MAG TPA: hypothetical protein ENN17_11100 [bacterium]|nr:hypothetical protein [bacterium]